MGLMSYIKDRLPTVKYGSRVVYGRRSPFRPATHAARSFNGAASNNLTASWGTAPETIDSVLSKDLTALRTRSREQARNNDYARRFVSMAKSNIVGPQGVVLRSQVNFPRGKPDQAAREAIEGAFKRWGRDCDVGGRNSWKDMQRLILGTVAIDGEALVREHRDGALNDCGLGLELVDPVLLDIRYNDVLAGGNIIRMGVEMNKLRRPVAYHLIDPAISPSATYFSGSNNHTRVPAGEMHHIFVQEYPGQTRGVPWMATALMRLNMLGGYEEAALVNARVGASKLGVITTEGGDYIGDDADSDGSPVVDAGDPGSWFQLREGESIQGYDPTYPTGEFPDFVKACLRGIASGLGVHYNILANDLEGVSYSSIRQAVIEDQEIWKGLQEWLIDSFVRPMFDSWLDSALGNGAIDVGGVQLSYGQKRRYARSAWQPRRWSWIDPLKDVQANVAAVDAGFTSRSAVIREMGSDPDDVWAEVETENELMDKYGVAVVGADFGGSPDGEDE